MTLTVPFSIQHRLSFNPVNTDGLNDARRIARLFSEDVMQ